MKLLTRGNAKLPKFVGCWSILAGMDGCGRVCDGCYAINIQRRFSSVYRRWDENLRLTKSADFVDLMSEEVSKFRIVRIHVSGDFYDKEYIDKWKEVIFRNPSVRFYGYTKVKEALSLNVFRNCNIIYSVVGSNGLNYGNEEYVNYLRSEGYFVCPDVNYNKSKEKVCMVKCRYCLSGDKVCFLRH